MTLDDQIRKAAVSAGAEFFGVADLSSAREAIRAQGGVEVASFPTAISLGIGLVDAIVDRLSYPGDPMVGALYGYYCYDLVNDQLDKIALRLVARLQSLGHKTFPVPAAPLAIDNAHLSGVFSSKMAAHLAGLGWIGRSCLLITPQRGPRVRWATVLTDAPLKPTGKPKDARCGECRACVEACPAHALTGKPFDPREPREARHRAEDCHALLRAVKEQTGHRGCGLCLKVCPHGRQMLMVGVPRQE